MLFVKENVVFVKKNVVNTKNGNKITFVTIADPETYENYTGILSSKCDISGITSGSICNASLMADGRYTNIIID